MTGYAKNSQTEPTADWLESDRTNRKPVMEMKNQTEPTVDWLDLAESTANRL